MKKLIQTLLVLLLSFNGFSQNYKIGKISKEELQEKFYPSDSSASAAYLYKNRKTYFDYDQAKGFVVVTEVHERIKIYNKDGYNWATKSIKHYSPDSGESEKVSIKDAKTFTLVNGKVKSVKLSKKSIFKEAKNKYWAVKKFTMPGISDGCVIEWKYKIVSPYRTIDDVIIQYSIPVKKFESSIEIPEYYRFAVKQSGYLTINEFKADRKKKEVSGTYRDSKPVGLSGKSNVHNYNFEYYSDVTKIEKSNIPALIEEPYVNNINNYRSLIEYELSSVKWPNKPIKYFSSTWSDVAKTIVESNRFGGELKKIKHLTEDLSLMNGNFKTDSQKIYGALNYVKSKIAWNNYYGNSTDKGLKKAFKEGSGNIAEVNLTLVAVLRGLGLNANPVLVSTRSNGVPNFPTISGFNYVVAHVETPEGIALLDASDSYSLPNVLPLRTLNWKGAIVKDNKTVDFVSMSSSAISTEEINLNYKISDDGLVEGMNRNKYINNAALSYRNSYGSVGEEDLKSNIEGNKGDIEILNYRATNVDNLSKPVIEMYKFEKEDGVEVIGDKMYISPLLYETTTENPFKLDDRQYPIDFGTKWEEKISVTIQIPEGYTVETLPENTAIGMTDEVGVFIYSVKNTGSKIQISSNVKMNDDVIPSTYYAELKQLFKLIVAKQTEKIVLTKK